MGHAISVCMLFSECVLITYFFGIVVTFSISQVFIKEHRQQIKTSNVLTRAVSEWLEANMAAPMPYDSSPALSVNPFGLG